VDFRKSTGGGDTLAEGRRYLPPVTDSDCGLSDNVPNVLGGVAELAARDAGAQAVVADTDRFVLECVGEVVLAFSHGSDKDADAFLGRKTLDVISYSDHLGIETQSDLAAVWWEMVGYGVLDDFEEFFLGVGGSDG